MTFSQIFDLEFWLKVDNNGRSDTDHGCPIIYMVKIGTSTLGYYLSSYKPCVEIMNCIFKFFYLTSESQKNHGKSLVEKVSSGDWSFETKIDRAMFLRLRNLHDFHA